MPCSTWRACPAAPALAYRFGDVTRGLLGKLAGKQGDDGKLAAATAPAPPEGLPEGLPPLRSAWPYLTLCLERPSPSPFGPRQPTALQAAPP